MRAQTQAFVELATCQLIVGANMAAMKFVVPLLPIYVQLELRFLISTFFLALIQFLLAKCSLVRPEEPLQRVTTREWCSMAVMGLLGGLLFNLLMMEGVALTSAMSAGIIASTMPALLAFFSFLFLRELFTRQKLIALALAVTGILILNCDVANGEASFDSSIGDFLVFLAMVPEAFYTIVGKKYLGNRLRPISVALIVNAVNVVYFAPLALYQSQHYDFDFWNTNVWLLTTLIALGSLQFYVLWQRGIQYVSGSTAALFVGLMPVGATLAAIIALGESFGLYEAGGMLAVTLSILVGANAFPRFRVRQPA